MEPTGAQGTSPLEHTQTISIAVNPLKCLPASCPPLLSCCSAGAFPGKTNQLPMNRSGDSVGRLLRARVGMQMSRWSSSEGLLEGEADRELSVGGAAQWHRPRVAGEVDGWMGSPGNWWDERLITKDSLIIKYLGGTLQSRSPFDVFNYEMRK